MDDRLAKIASNLDSVVREMVTKSNLEDYLCQKLTSATETLSKEIETKNDNMIEQLDKRVCQLETENGEIKRIIGDMEAELEQEDELSSVETKKESMWMRLKSKLRRPFNLGTFLVVSGIIAISLPLATENIEKIIGSKETVVKTFGCADLDQVSIMPQEECMITWSYEVSFADMSWLYQANCRDLCTDREISYTTFDKLDAIKTCIEKLYDILPKESQSSLAPNCSKCEGEFVQIPTNTFKT